MRDIGIIGPFAGLQPENATADHIGNRHELAARGELDGGTDGIAARQPEKTSPESVSIVHINTFSAKCSGFISSWEGC
jgi:hypothetical protein